MAELYELLKKELEKSGMAVRIAAVRHVRELGEEIARLREQSLLDEQFYDENLSWMDFDYKNIMPDAQAVIVGAKRQYPTLLHFEHKDMRYRITIPPTYVYGKDWSTIENMMARILAPHGYETRKARLPSKLLAVRTGLGLYGRNNICYVKGMGSFHRLFTLYTNMPPARDDWQGIKVMPECGQCDFCVRACPTKCIERERFLIHADRCITRFNESEKEFPQWLDKSWHNSIVGCMRCQVACPGNRDFLGKTEGEVAFTQEETGLILEKPPLDSLPPALRQKLDSLDMTEYYEVLGRNLEVLIN